MDEDKKEAKTKREIIPEKADPVEEGMKALEEILINSLKIDPSDPKLKTVMKGFMAIGERITRIERIGEYHSDEIYRTKQKIHKSS